MRTRLSERLSSKRILSAWMGAAVFGLIPGTALAVVPKIVGTPVVANPSFDGNVNTMMYTVSVTVDSFANNIDHSAVVGFTSDYTTCAGTTSWKWSRAQVFDTVATKTWTLYNFQPGETYYYKVVIGDPAGTPRTRCGSLTTAAAPTPTLPTNLSYLNLDFAKSGTYDTKYVFMETDDCGGSGASSSGARDNLVVLDTENETIVWYMDIASFAGLHSGAASGWRYQPGTSTTSGRILLTVSRRYLWEFGFDGTIVNSRDFGTGDECEGDIGSEGPCVHHDAFKSDSSGKTFVIAGRESAVDAIDTAWEDACGTDARFIDDGYQVLSRTYAVSSSKYLMTNYGYDPTVDGGPNAEESAEERNACVAGTWTNFFDPTYGLIDWTHVNSLAASKFSGQEVLDISLMQWDQILRVNASTGAAVWTLSANAADSDWGTLNLAPGVVGAANFAGQHGVHAIANNKLMMLDNNGNSPDGSRVLQIGLTMPPRAATIEKSWAMVDAAGDPLECPLEGSGEQVPDSTGSHVLAMCNDEYSIAELSDATGNTGTAPPLSISLPDGTTDDFCSVGGPTDRSTIRGWHRAFPLATVGEF